MLKINNELVQIHKSYSANSNVNFMVGTVMEEKIKLSFSFYKILHRNLYMLHCELHYVS